MKFSVGLLLGLLIGCSTMIAGQLRFQDRELLIHPDKACTLAYPYKKTVCVQRTGLGRILGKKCHSENVMDEYDLSKLEVRKSLNDALFSCVSKGRFKY